MFPLQRWSVNLRNRIAHQDAGNRPIQLPLGQSLEARDELRLSVIGYTPSNNGEALLPTRVRAVVDNQEIETECREDNNDHTVEVLSGEARAELSIDLEDVAGCPEPTAELTVTNNGSTGAEDVLIVLYAGDPSQGGIELTRLTLDEPIAPGAESSAMLKLAGFPQGRDITVFAVVDPQDAIAECNDGNNRASLGPVKCGTITRPK